MHMYAFRTWVIILGCDNQAMSDGVHVQSEMNIWSTFNGHGMGHLLTFASIGTSFGFQTLHSQNSRTFGGDI